MPSLGDLVALYAAILSTYLAWSQWQKSRHPVVVFLRPDALGDTATFRVRAVNVSPQPIVIEAVGLGFRVDYRRAHVEILTGYKTRIGPLQQGRFTLGVYDNVDGHVPQSDMAPLLHGEPPKFVVYRDENGIPFAEGWEGDPPFRLANVWARDITGRFHRGRIDRDLKDTGYYEWDKPPPMLRGRLTGAWYRFCVELWLFQKAGPIGPRIANLLGTLRLFPVKLGEPPPTR